jgi:RHS repeat-associated protein
MNASCTQDFNYDHLNRLVQAVSNGYGPLTWQYNQTGNMTYNSQLGSYAYGTKPHAVTQAGSNTYGYDANGNMINKAGVSITYDYDNRPAATGTTSFVYDSSGQRVKKITPGTTITYIGKHYECTNGVCKKYVFAGSQRIAVKTNTDTWYYHPDHLGSSGIVTDSTGNKSEAIYYYPYGGTRQDIGVVSVKHKFTGQELDDETGLYYYGARYYDPQLGRFISADSIVQAPFDPQTLNRYSYCRNNPIIYSDPSGHSWVSDWLDDAGLGFVNDYWQPVAEVAAATVGNAACGPVCGAFAAGLVNYGITGSIESGIATVVTAGLFYGAGEIAPGNPFAHAAAGAIGGGFGAAITGGDIGQGMLTGGISGFTGTYFGNMLPNDYASQLIGRSLIGGISGGITATIYGGDFGEGFKQGAVTAGFAFMFNDGFHTSNKPTYDNEGVTYSYSMDVVGLEAPNPLLDAVNHIGLIGGGVKAGFEITIGKNWRFAPFGNRTGNLTGELPHYHRRILDSNGKTVPGGGIGWHRPWQRGW